MWGQNGRFSQYDEFANNPLADLVRWAQVAPPQVLGSTPVGANFRLGLKKIPSHASTPKHMERSDPLSPGEMARATVPLCTGGVGVRGYSWSA